MRMPKEVTEKISQRALQIVQLTAPRKTGRGVGQLRAYSAEGEVGIEIPDEVHYMEYQDQGIKPFVMKDLAGKTIPIRRPDGTIIFRRATEDNVGRRRITARNEKGQIITSKITWRHPGLKPKNFIKNALDQAVREWVYSVEGREAVQMLEGSDLSDYIKVIKGNSL